MKYARLVYGNNESRMASKQFSNVGNFIQTFALDEIYRRLNIDKTDIVTIDRIRITEYKGEKVILPMQGRFVDTKGARVFPLPDEIEPVFVGYSTVSKAHFNVQCIKTYRNHAPVCCRDEGTYKLMKKHGIDAYLTGCLTLLLPERQKEPGENKVFLVDAPLDIEKYMPEELRKNIAYVTQEVKWNPADSDENELKRMEVLSGEILKRYQEEATLVVTSRLHCAAPCMAMGIPVIMVRNYFDERYMWIDKFLPLYTPDRFKEIDWYTEKVDLSEIKSLLFEMVSAIILDSSDKEKAIRRVHDFYMGRKRGKIEIPFRARMYREIGEKAPRFADFMREVVLKKYSVATARDFDFK